jgi:tRNA1Val (adenine37-N6)-methyltransferase
MNDDYSQPDFYRFNSDSIELVREIIGRNRHYSSILDLGAGCGIIGIEIAKKIMPSNLVLLELQEEFFPHLVHNCKTFLPSQIRYDIIINSFYQFESILKFDLIVCNPPYYLPGKGVISKNPLRAKSRSFIIDSWKILLSKIVHLLEPKGKAFIVLKEDPVLFNKISLELDLLEFSLSKISTGQLMILELSSLDKK